MTNVGTPSMPGSELRWSVDSLVETRQDYNQLSRMHATANLDHEDSKAKGADKSR